MMMTVTFIEIYTGTKRSKGSSIAKLKTWRNLRQTERS